MALSDRLNLEGWFMATRVSSPVFVGRAAQLARGRELLEGISMRGPAVLFVTGEAGVGKTRFLGELTREARALGGTVLEGGCSPIGADSLPFGPFVEAIRGLTHQLQPTELDRVVGRGRADLARLLPHFERPGDSPPMPGDASGQGRLFEHILALFERLSERAPVFLVIEDIHWADRSSLELLVYLVRNLRRGPILLAATYRDDDLRSRDSLAQLAAELDRADRIERLQLEPFSEAELTEVLSGILGRTPEIRLVDEIQRRSNGNAFHAEELLAARGQTRLPESLRAALLGRLSTLTPAGRALVRAAAAGGTVVDPPLLEEVTGTDNAELDDLLRETVNANVFVPVDAHGKERYSFRHALMQEVLYADLLPRERTRLHAAFARALESQPERAAVAGALAHHLQGAHDLPRAFRAWIDAGLAAEGMAAFAEAAASFGRALAMWDEIDDAAARAPFDQAELFARAAVAEDLMAQSSGRARQYVLEAIRRVDPASDPARAGLLYERLGQYCIGVSDVEGARAAFEHAVRLVPPEPPTAARAWALSGFGHFYAVTGDAASSLPLCREAVAVAQAVGAVDAELRSLVPLGGDLVLVGDVDAGIDALCRARDLALEVGSVPDAARAMAWLSMGLYQAGRNHDGVEAALVAVEYAIDHGLGSRWAPAALPVAADLLVALGNWDEAEQALQRAAAYATPGDADHVLESRFLLLETLVGHLDRARERANELEAWASRFGGGLSAFEGPVEYALWTGDAGRARRLMAELMPTLDVARPLVRWMGHALWLALRAEADIAATRTDGGRREDGAWLRDRVAALVDEVRRDRPYYSAMLGRWAALADAEWSRVIGGSDPDQWATAADQQIEPYLRAYALMREGEAILALARGDARVAGVLGEARAIAIELGARPLRERVEMLLGLTPRRSTRRPATATSSRAGPFDLSSREREVLELLADGRSDGEIAAALFISKKTASVHITHIKDKLGATSRVEIVLNALRRGLVVAPPTNRDQGGPP